MRNNSLTNNLNSVKHMFHTVDNFKSDFKKCGQKMKEAKKHFDIKIFDHSDNFIKCIYGLQNETINANLSKGKKTIKVDCLDYFREGRTVLIYNIKNRVYEFNTIADIAGNYLILSKNLQNDYPKSSKIVVIRQVEYKLYPIRGILKRRIDRGKFQLLARKVTGLLINYMEYSKFVNYWIELNNNAQIKGEIFLFEMV